MRYKGILILVLVGLLIFSLIPTENASAETGSSAKLDKVDVTTDPPLEQVMGEVVEVKATFHIYGGCCYHLYTHNVLPVTDFPEGIEVISGPNPDKYDEVDGLPGGEPILNSFRWKVRGKAPGNYTLEVEIVTDNSGSVKGECFLLIECYTNITTPSVIPSRPRSGRELSISFNAEPPYERDISKLSLYYVIMDEDLDNFTAEKDLLTLYYSDGRVKRIAGTEMKLDSSNSEDSNYTAVISSLEGSGYVYYWIYAMDSDGVAVTTPVYKLRIEDDETDWLPILLVIILILAVSVLILIFIIKWKQRNDKK